MNQESGQYDIDAYLCMMKIWLNVFPKQWKDAIN